jgi:nitrogen fixation-related uncharacterized protein
METFNEIFFINIHPLQCLTTLLGLGIVCGFVSLVTTLIAVACSQFDKLKSTILDIRQEYITPLRGQEDGGYNAIANSIVQAKLNVCIHHHQGLME